MKTVTAPSVPGEYAEDSAASATQGVLSRYLPKPLVWKLAVGACAWLFLCATSTWAATYLVGIGDDCNVGASCFNPSQLTIYTGDSVEFYNYAETSFTGPHNVVADDGSFRCARGCDGEGGDGTPVGDSICDEMGYCVHAPNWRFSRTFSVPGVVKYHDEVSKAAGVIYVKLGQSFNLYISEIYSNAGGSVQFIVLWPGVPGSGLAGIELVSSSGVQQNRYTFPNDAVNYPTPGRSTPVLLATQGFADLQLVKPDFIMPDGFLFAPKGSIGVMNRFYTYEYTSLPTDGMHALYPAIDYDIGSISYNVGPAVAVDNVRQYAALAPIPILQVVEYYHAVLDDFFLTALPEEMNALDTGQIPGWQRTGYKLPTWTGPAADAFIIPDLGPVCRVWLGTSHFYSVSGCADALAIPGSVPETGSAFYATLPDVDTGACPSSQLPVFRLWNPRGTSHRYTTQTDVRDDMLRRGFVSEGYGPDGVAMCVPDSSAP